MTEEFLLDKKVEDQVESLGLLPRGKEVLMQGLHKAAGPSKWCTRVLYAMYAGLVGSLTLAFINPIAGLMEAAEWVLITGGAACLIWIAAVSYKMFTLEREADGDKASWYLHWHQMWVWQKKHLSWPIRVAGLLVPSVLLLFHNYYGSALLYSGIVAAVWVVGAIVASEVTDFLTEEYGGSTQTY